MNDYPLPGLACVVHSCVRKGFHGIVLRDVTPCSPVDMYHQYRNLVNPPSSLTTSAVHRDHSTQANTLRRNES
jgi:hypothetical protein